MFNKIFQKFIIFVVLLFPLVHHAAFASEIFPVESTHSEIEKLLGLLFHEDNKDFLNKLIISTYEEGKSKPKLQAKMCTHSNTIVQAWKGFIKKAPSPLSQDQWDDTIGRKEIYVFTTPDPLALLDEHVNKPVNVTHKIDNRGKIALYADYAIGKAIGEKYTDTTILKGKRKKAAPDNDYKNENLKNIRIIIDIGSLIQKMSEFQRSGKNDTEILPQSTVNLAEIVSICPQG